MISKEEELKKYLAKRERKKNRSERVEINETPARETSEKIDPRSFTTLFYLSNGKSRWIITITIAVVLCIGLAVLLNFAGQEQSVVVQLCVSLFILINLLFFGSVFIRLDRYRKFASGKLVPVSGWDHFIAGRSSGFWQSGDYANVCIQFDQDQRVSELERKALNAFIQTWINTWGFRYNKKQKWTNNAPQDFRRVGATRMEGHANIENGIPFMMNQLMDELPQLLNVLTADTLKVTVSSAGSDLSTRIDDAEERELERRSDEYYRNMNNKD